MCLISLSKAFFFLAALLRVAGQQEIHHCQMCGLTFSKKEGEPGKNVNFFEATFGFFLRVAFAI